MPSLDQYNPDVLTCLANLSSDEIFTPPKLANRILDMLPADLWSNKNARFLDPACKSGVFLREIAKRLDIGLEKEIPDRQTRINHIFQNQLFGLSITELTSLLSRRSVYCSKKANGKYSVCETFNNPQGNIRFKRVEHQWDDGRCVFCSASQENYDRDETLETHAYQFIHIEKPEEIFKMKFDVIIGNPPYQLDTGGSGRQAKPIYQLFVQQAKKLKPRFLTMIIPSRWFAGGMGLDEFRDDMLHDKHISHLIDYTNAKDCFQGISISGGVNYFLWQRDYNGPCRFTSVHDNKSNTIDRYLDEFPVLVRHNEAVTIIHKVLSKNEKSISNIVSSINPFGFPTSARGQQTSKKNMVKLYSSKGVGYVSRNEVSQGIELIDKYKIMVSQTISEHAGEPCSDGTFKLLSTVKILSPGEICTFSYISVGPIDSQEEANNLKVYLETRFARFLILQAVSSIHLSKEKFIFLPLQNFGKSWTDEKLYKKYDLTNDEVNFIESMVRPMEASDEKE
jgi:site-specific DNA-methyltransferase (adenine-specific)